MSDVESKLNKLLAEREEKRQELLDGVFDATKELLTRVNTFAKTNVTTCEELNEVTCALMTLIKIIKRMF